MNVRHAQYSLIGFMVVMFMIVIGAKELYYATRTPDFVMEITHNMEHQTITASIDTDTRCELNVAEWQYEDIFLRTHINSIPGDVDCEITLFGTQFNVWKQPHGVYLLYLQGWDGLLLTTKDIREIHEYLYNWARE